MGDVQFEFWLEDGYSDFFLSPSMQVPQSGHGYFLLNPFKFIIHPSS
jgi:hypothetical protein